MFKVVRCTDHPVVKTYMDIIADACKRTGIAVEDVEHKSKKIRKTDVIVSDSPIVSIYYILRGYRNIITWSQGILPEESFLKNHSKMRCYVLSLIEKVALKKSSLVLLVSRAMKEHYENRYKINLSNKTVIMPCFNELQINKESFKCAGKYEKNTFLYVGGLQNWQCFDQIAYVYSQIEKRSKTAASFHVFTASKEAAENIMKKHNIKNYFIDFVSKEELADRIKNMKYGFVLREDCAINNVATPTKFSNYLSNGIIPIYSNSLRSFFEYDKTAGIGVICNLNDLEGGIEEVLKSMDKEVHVNYMYEKCKGAFQTYYNKDKYEITIFKKIAELRLGL